MSSDNEYKLYFYLSLWRSQVWKMNAYLSKKKKKVFNFTKKFWWDQQLEEYMYIFFTDTIRTQSDVLSKQIN